MQTEVFLLFSLQYFYSFFGRIVLKVGGGIGEEDHKDYYCGCYTYVMADSEDILRIMLFIEDNLHIHYPIPQLAVEMGINAHELKKAFKKMVGTGVYAYLRMRRLEKAKELLLDTKLPLKQIAGKAGYRHTSNFCSAFKKQYGMTPGEIRRGKEV